MVQASHILVGGGTGFVGRYLVKCLRSNGARVQVVTRKPKGQDEISWDKLRCDGLPKETTAVVNLAGRNILDPSFWTEAFKREIYESRIETNKLLVKAIHSTALKPKAFVTVSGVGYYPPSNDVVYDENWTQSESLRDKKNYLMNLAEDWEKSGELSELETPSTRRVVIRSGVVVGNGGGIVKNSKLPFSFGLGGPIGDGNQWFPWIHVEDLAEMFKFAITNDHVNGVINGVAPEQIRNKDFASAFAQALGRPALISAPSFAINLLFGSERGEILLKGQRVTSCASKLGFRYKYPNIKEACEESVSK